LTYSVSDYPKPSQLKWAMLVVLFENDRPMLSSEIDRNVATLLGVSDQMFEFVLESGKQYMPYRLGWERTKAQKFGFIEKAPALARHWQLTDKGRKIATRKINLFLD
jgi:hypothetical protein